MKKNYQDLVWVFIFCAGLTLLSFIFLSITSRLENYCDRQIIKSTMELEKKVDGLEVYFGMLENNFNNHYHKGLKRKVIVENEIPSSK